MDVCSACLSQGLPLWSLLGFAGQGQLLETWGLGRRRCCWPTAWSRCWFTARRVASTRGSTGAPKGACREEAGGRGDTSCRRGLEEGAEWGLRGAGLGQGKAKGAFWGRETWLCPYCCFLSPPQQGRHKPPDPGGLLSRERVRGQGAFGACTNLSLHEDTFVAPHAPRQEQSLCTLG